VGRAEQSTAPNAKSNRKVSNHRGRRIRFPKAMKQSSFCRLVRLSPPRARRVRILLKEAKSKKPLVISIAPKVK